MQVASEVFDDLTALLSQRPATHVHDQGLWKTRRVVKGCNDASGGACAYMAIRSTPVIKTRKRRILLIHPLGRLPPILAN